MASANTPAAQSLGRRERKKAETRQRILSAAAHLFTSQGFEATTIDEIAEHADVSRGTFFNYYSEKSALMAALGDGMTKTLIEHIAAARELDAPTVGRLAKLFAGSAARLTERRDLSRAVLRETVARRSGLDESHNHTATLHACMEQLLRDGVDAGDVRSDVPTSLLAEMVAGAYVEVLVSWIMADDYPLAERLQMAAEILGAALDPQAAKAERRRSSTRARNPRVSKRQRVPKR
ncbi:MAG: TetR/AcrR family transcriptional regulator [Deltaproteobacteria bacterium]|nr:TetR/AcrR family transcriptional regulator [Deltaproteobacteria bacterium]MBW2361300.1 TetR/AcrR family transcriptional regulator [Deltaproteobacteria bacterium]